MVGGRVPDVRQTSVRFSDDQWARIQAEAERTGVSAGQVVRDFTLAGFAYRDGLGDAAELREQLAAIEKRLAALERRG